MTSDNELEQKNGSVSEKGDLGIPGCNTLMKQPTFDVPVIVKSKNPNYFTFLKIITKDPKSPYFKKQESELFPIAINIGSCGCYTVFDSPRDFPNRDLQCKHNNYFIKFERLL